MFFLLSYLAICYLSSASFKFYPIILPAFLPSIYNLFHLSLLSFTPSIFLHNIHTPVLSPVSSPVSYPVSSPANATRLLLSSSRPPLVLLLQNNRQHMKFFPYLPSLTSFPTSYLSSLPPRSCQSLMNLCLSFSFSLSLSLSLCCYAITPPVRKEARVDCKWRTDKTIPRFSLLSNPRYQAGLRSLRQQT